MGIYELINHFNNHINELDTLTQFYVSSMVYIIGLYFLNHLVEVYMENETLQNMAYTDFLTRLPNRRKIESLMQREYYEAKNSLAPLSLIMLDIDNFKKINDTFGHDLGDLVLKSYQILLAKILEILTI